MLGIGGCLRKWLRGNEGVTAIEFSLLAVPFCIAAIGIIELALMFVSGSLLNGAVNDAARLIRTGQVQQSEDEDPQEMFQEALCSIAGILLDCGSFQYQVKTLDSFSDAEEEELETDDEGNLVEQPFDTGGSNDIVMIRVIYLYPLMTPFIGQFFSDYTGNKKLLMSTIVIETEPYI